MTAHLCARQSLGEEEVDDLKSTETLELLRAGDQVLALTYLGPVTLFERYRPDFQRLLDSVRLGGER